MKALSALAFSTAWSISLSSIATIQPAFAALENEPNNSFITKQFLPSNTTTVNGQLESGDVDFFGFSNLDTGNLFTAEINSNTIDPVLGLLDNSGNIQAINDNKSDNSVLSLLTGKVPTSGNLNFAVSGLRDINLIGDHLESGSYTLSLNTFNLPQTSTNPTILNGGFETGNFTGWTTLGETSIETKTFGSKPTEGNYQALLSTGNQTFSGSIIEEFLGLEAGSLDNLGKSLDPFPFPGGQSTQGSAIQQTFTGKTGDILTFDWNFLSNEEQFPSLNDFAFVSIGSLSDLADVLSPTVISSTTEFFKETGFNTFSFKIPTTGTYSLGIGVTDWRDSSTDSGLLIDNVKIISVPESNYVLSLLGFGVLGLILRLKSKQQNKVKSISVHR
jgi:hypothetical protein